MNKSFIKKKLKEIGFTKFSLFIYKISVFTHKKLKIPEAKVA